MKFYAIKHIPSGGFLPQRERRGHTFEEPSAGCVPRLFPKERSAKLALRAWLAGEWNVRRGKDIDTPFSSGEYFEDLDIQPKAERKAEDMAVVVLAITEEAK